MQVHDQPQGAPVLALAGDSVSLKRMQNHAPYACMVFCGKKAGFSERANGFDARSVPRAGGLIQVLCGCKFFTVIIA